MLEHRPFADPSPSSPTPPSAPPPPGGDDKHDLALALILAALAAMSLQVRNEVLAFLDFWRDIPREDRALFAKSVRPTLSDEAIARLAGVTPRTLYRWERYQRFKQQAIDFRHSKLSRRLSDAS